MPANSRCEKTLTLFLKLRVQNSEKVPVENFQATEQGLTFFEDVSGRFSSFSFRFLLTFRKLFGAILFWRSATLATSPSDTLRELFKHPSGLLMPSPEPYDYVSASFHSSCLQPPDPSTCHGQGTSPKPSSERHPAELLRPLLRGALKRIDARGIS